MKWKDAEKLLRKGEKIRREFWAEGSYIHDTDPVKYSGGGMAFFALKWFDAIDWEVYEEVRLISKEKFILQVGGSGDVILGYRGIVLNLWNPDGKGMEFKQLIENLREGDRLLIQYQGGTNNGRKSNE